MKPYTPLTELELVALTAQAWGAPHSAVTEKDNDIAALVRTLEQVFITGKRPVDPADSSSLELDVEAYGESMFATCEVKAEALRELQRQAAEGRRLDALVNNPQTAEFLAAVKAEAAHQVERWGEAHDRGKSAENWFWLVGYLAGKALRAAITSDKEKALHHTISSAAALANWHQAIVRDSTGVCLGHDADIKPIEIARFERGGLVDCGECPRINTGCEAGHCMKAG